MNDKIIYAWISTYVGLEMCDGGINWIGQLQTQGQRSTKTISKNRIYIQNICSCIFLIINDESLSINKPWFIYIYIYTLNIRA